MDFFSLSVIAEPDNTNGYHLPPIPGPHLDDIFNGNDPYKNMPTDYTVSYYGHKKN